METKQYKTTVSQEGSQNLDRQIWFLRCLLGVLYILQGQLSAVLGRNDANPAAFAACTQNVHAEYNYWSKSQEKMSVC